MANAALRRATCQLYVKPKVLMFGRGRAKLLEHALEDIDRDTTVYSLADAEELQITNTGLTIYGGYRYTALAFRELCQMLAAGSTAFLLDLAGMTRRADATHDSLVDGHLACSTFNKVIDLRYPLCSTCRVIRNEDTKLIEGFVGAKHQSLDNQTLLQQTNQAILDADNEFYAATLTDRRMSLWYRGIQPIFTRVLQSEPWKFYRGYYFCNGEARGTSVRGTAAIFTRQGLCLAPYDEYGGRLAHVGRDFHRRLDKLFSKLLAKEIPTQQLYQGCDTLIETPMGFVGLREKKLEERIDKLARSLMELGVPLRIGREVVEAALFSGRPTRASAGQPVPFSVNSDDVFAQRTMFDVFCCLATAARAVNTRRREILEQAAYGMLASGFTA